MWEFQLAQVVVNKGYSSSYGNLEECLYVGQIVEILYQDDCCYKIKTDSGEEYILNMSRFKLI